MNVNAFVLLLTISSLLIVVTNGSTCNTDTVFNGPYRLEHLCESNAKKSHRCKGPALKESHLRKYVPALQCMDIMYAKAMESAEKLEIEVMEKFQVTEIPSASSEVDQVERVCKEKLSGVASSRGNSLLEILQSTKRLKKKAQKSGKQPRSGRKWFKKTTILKSSKRLKKKAQKSGKQPRPARKWFKKTTQKVKDIVQGTFQSKEPWEKAVERKKKEINRRKRKEKIRKKTLSFLKAAGHWVLTDKWLNQTGLGKKIFNFMRYKVLRKPYDKHILFKKIEFVKPFKILESILTFLKERGVFKSSMETYKNLLVDIVHNAKIYGQFDCMEMQARKSYYNPDAKRLLDVEGMENLKIIDSGVSMRNVQSVVQVLVEEKDFTSSDVKQKKHIYCKHYEYSKFIYKAITACINDYDSGNIMNSVREVTMNSKVIKVDGSNGVIMSFPNNLENSQDCNYVSCNTNLPFPLALNPKSKKIIALIECKDKQHSFESNGYTMCRTEDVRNDCNVLQTDFVGGYNMSIQCNGRIVNNARVKINRNKFGGGSYEVSFVDVEGALKRRRRLLQGGSSGGS